MITYKGLHVKNMLGCSYLKVRYPHLQRERKKIDWNQKLSVHIHVERIIGVVKQKYTALQNILLISLISDARDTVSTID